MEEEPESFIDQDDEQEWIKNHRRVILDESSSTPDYLSKIYENLVLRRYEERRLTSSEFPTGG